MEKTKIQGKTINEWNDQYPLMDRIISTEEVFWTNGKYGKFNEGIKQISLSEKDVNDAEERLKRFAPYIAKVFPVDPTAIEYFEKKSLKLSLSIIE